MPLALLRVLIEEWLNSDTVYLEAEAFGQEKPFLESMKILLDAYGNTSYGSITIHIAGPRSAIGRAPDS